MKQTTMKIRTSSIKMKLQTKLFFKLPTTIGGGAVWVILVVGAACQQ